MQPCPADELCTAQLPDRRSNRRLACLVDHLSAQPEASVPQACGSGKDTKAAYCCWANPCVSPAAILGMEKKGHT